MKLFVSTGEISGDLNAAIVVREIKKLRPDIQIVACGGEQLRSAGVDALLDSNPIRVMGFFEVFLRLPRILSFFRKYKSFILEHHPDAFLLVDAPGFHFKFLKFYLTFKKPMFYLIPPKVWVWKKQRLAQMKRFFKKIYLILPFELEIYKKAQISAAYYGNLLAEKLVTLDSREDLRTRYGLSLSQRTLLVLLGSRSSEIRSHLKIWKRVQEYLPQEGVHYQFVLPDGQMYESLIRELSKVYHSGEHWAVSVGDAHAWMRMSDFGVIKSGTSTLEAAVLGLPHLMFYKSHWLSEWVFKHLIRYDKAISLVNLMGQNDHPSTRITSEFVLDQLDPVKMADEIKNALRDSEWLKEQTDKLNFVRRLLLPSGEEEVASLLAKDLLNELTQQKAEIK